MSKAQVPITWTTPAGFPVVQRYPNWERYQIDTVFFGKTMRLQARDEGMEIEKDKQVTAISPNFVHSMDAAALSLYVLRAPFTSFAVVHDAYGTTAANVDQMNHALRAAFVGMYQNHDVLVEFRESCIKALGTDEGIPPVPSAGTLDISKVTTSEYFFA
jgi:DNA-directed RNA polymerase